MYRDRVDALESEVVSGALEIKVDVEVGELVAASQDIKVRSDFERKVVFNSAIAMPLTGGFSIHFARLASGCRVSELKAALHLGEGLLTRIWADYSIACDDTAGLLLRRIT